MRHTFKFSINTYKFNILLNLIITHEPLIFFELSSSTIFRDQLTLIINREMKKR